MISETAEARVIDDDSNIGGSDIEIIAVPINPIPVVEADAVSMHSFEVSVDELRTARLHTALALEVLRRRDYRYGGGGSAVSLVKILISLFFLIIIMIYLIL